MRGEFGGGAAEARAPLATAIRLAQETELAAAISEWIEAWYSPRRSHANLDELSPAEFETLHTTAHYATLNREPQPV